MDSFTPIPLLSFAPVIAVVAVVAAGVAAVTGRRLVAILFGLVAIAAVAGAVLWTIVP
jgi:hypothetical protein